MMQRASEICASLAKSNTSSQTDVPGENTSLRLRLSRVPDSRSDRMHQRKHISQSPRLRCWLLDLACSCLSHQPLRLALVNSPSPTVTSVPPPPLLRLPLRSHPSRAIPLPIRGRRQPRRRAKSQGAAPPPSHPQAPASPIPPSPPRTSRRPARAAQDSGSISRCLQISHPFTKPLRLYLP